MKKKLALQMTKECSDCPVNAKCGICETYINWIKEHRIKNEKSN